MKTYRAYGLNIDSEIALTELPLVEGEPDIVIRNAKFTDPWDSDPEHDLDFHQTPEGILLSWNQYGRFLIRAGREILVEPAVGVDDTYIRHLLFGPVLSVLNYQRGLFIFHASGVVLPSGGAVFMADAGYGKSTQAEALVRRGHSLITDDVLLMKLEHEKIWAMPGVPFLKLWPETISLLGEDPNKYPTVKTSLPKRTLNKIDIAVQQPVALKAVFILEFGEKIEIKRLAPMEALQQIMPHWYGVLYEGELLPILGLERHFRDCTTVVQNLPVYRLTRPESLDFMPAICEAVECTV
jgi:hypothetical protein